MSGRRSLTAKESWAPPLLRREEFNESLASDSYLTARGSFTGGLRLASGRNTLMGAGVGAAL